MKLKLARGVKKHKKSFYKYEGLTKGTKQNVGPLLNEMGDLVAQDLEKV